MHLKHYANCELGSGLADCTNWSHEHRPIHKQNFTIDFKDWLTKQKEKHLFADLSQDTIQAVIRVALSGAELDQTLFVSRILRSWFFDFLVLCVMELVHATKADMTPYLL